jgi:hypothetical protein
MSPYRLEKQSAALSGWDRWTAVANLAEPVPPWCRCVLVFYRRAPQQRGEPGAERSGGASIRACWTEKKPHNPQWRCRASAGPRVNVRTKAKSRALRMPD